ncbi:glycosyltransferase, partial [bacterium]|nr:glycosyltransferase [bacterium]
PETGVPRSRQIVCPARLRVEKNHEGLLRTFSLVRDRVPDARLALAGDGPLRERLVRTAESLGLRDSVSFLGHMSDMRSLYAESRLCALLSSAEGPALGVLEAQCSGRPCVVSAVGGLVDSVEHDISGLVVSAGDESAAADAITRLLLDDDLAARMGHAAAERVRRHFDFTVVSRQYKDSLVRVANAARVGVRV